MRSIPSPCLGTLPHHASYNHKKIILFTSHITKLVPNLRLLDAPNIGEISGYSKSEIYHSILKKGWNFLWKSMPNFFIYIIPSEKISVHLGGGNCEQSPFRTCSHRHGVTSWWLCLRRSRTASRSDGLKESGFRCSDGLLVNIVLAGFPSQWMWKLTATNKLKASRIIDLIM